MATEELRSKFARSEAEIRQLNDRYDKLVEAVKQRKKCETFSRSLRSSRVCVSREWQEKQVSLDENNQLKEQIASLSADLQASMVQNIRSIVS